MMYSHEQIIDGTVLFQIVIIFSYLISAFAVANEAYAGFNAVLTGFIFAAFTGLSYYGLRKNINRTIFGVILGGAFILMFVSLESAIFWGQYANCEPYKQNEEESRRLSDFGHSQLLASSQEYLCLNRPAMKSVCAFSVFMFLSYVVMLGILMKFKNEILGTAPLDEGYSRVSTANTDKDIVT